MWYCNWILCVWVLPSAGAPVSSPSQSPSLSRHDVDRFTDYLASKAELRAVHNAVDSTIASAAAASRREVEDVAAQLRRTVADCDHRSRQVEPQLHARVDDVIDRVVGMEVRVS